MTADYFRAAHQSPLQFVQRRRQGGSGREGERERESELVGTCERILEATMMMMMMINMRGDSGRKRQRWKERKYEEERDGVGATQGRRIKLKSP